MIEEICRKYKIVNYTINPDGSIDVDGGVNLYRFDLTKLPLKFNKVSGDFLCGDNRLTSIEGCPKSVGGYFDCGNNNLTSLVGCPNIVGMGFYCGENELTSLVGCPKEVGGNFECNDNKLTSLVGCPDQVGDAFDCVDNLISDLTGLNKFNGIFYCGGNPISSIFNEVEQDFTYAFQVYQIINGNEVNLKRLKYIMSTWDRSIYLEDIERHYKIV